MEPRAAGAGFTHRQGEVVTIAAVQRGALANRVTTSDKAPPRIATALRASQRRRSVSLLGD